MVKAATWRVVSARTCSVVKAANWVVNRVCRLVVVIDAMTPVVSDAAWEVARQASMASVDELVAPHVGLCGAMALAQARAVVRDLVFVA